MDLSMILNSSEEVTVSVGPVTALNNGTAGGGAVPGVNVIVGVGAVVGPNYDVAPAASQGNYSFPLSVTASYEIYPTVDGHPAHPTIVPPIVGFTPVTFAVLQARGYNYGPLVNVTERILKDEPASIIFILEDGFATTPIVKNCINGDTLVLEPQMARTITDVMKETCRTTKAIQTYSLSEYDISRLLIGGFTYGIQKTAEFGHYMSEIQFQRRYIVTKTRKTYLGRGGYGSVYRVIPDDDIEEAPLTERSRVLEEERIALPNVVVLKKAFRHGSESILDHDSRHEWSIHRELDHENIVQAFEYHPSWCGAAYLVLENATNDNLWELVHQSPFSIITRFHMQGFYLLEDQARNIFRQIFNGVKYLHDNHIVHRDLKEDNILMFENGVAKICDFGLSIKLPEKGARDFSGSAGTHNYVSPELYRNDPNNRCRAGVGVESDIWALGVMLYEVILGRHPFDPEGRHHYETIHDNQEAKKEARKAQMARTEGGTYEFDDAQNGRPAEHVISHQAKHLIALMLQTDWRQRATIQECLDHAWLNSWVYDVSVEDSSGSEEQGPEDAQEDASGEDDTSGEEEQEPEAAQEDASGEDWSSGEEEQEPEGAQEEKPEGSKQYPDSGYRSKS